MSFTFCSNTHECANVYCERRLSKHAEQFIESSGIFASRLPFDCIQKKINSTVQSVGCKKDTSKVKEIDI